MFEALKNLFARPPGGKGAARLVLNVGGGGKSVALPPHFQGWEQLLLDIDPRVGADLVCDARALRESAAANSFDAIYCSHNLEHYYPHDVDKVPHEIIVIGDARALAEGYNRALGQARHDIVLLAHDDASILRPDFAARLLRGMSHHDLVGVAGTRKLAGGAWFSAGYPHLAGQIGMPTGDGGYGMTLYDVMERETKGLQALDGLLLATRRETALRLGFDEATFEGWHLYDLDFSLRASQEGLDCATCNDILVVRDPQGSYDEHWLKYSQRFLDKHKIRLGPMQSVFFKPELVSLALRSAEEWRLLTLHLIGGDN
ncbi:MAG: hypothetical protein HY848_00825 [Betaproteobacteria bacterium]|nr:hypothetical protein [Betaproteobacteria bacterium]